MSHSEQRRGFAAAQLRAGEAAEGVEARTTIVGGQPSGVTRRSLRGIPVGVEKVLFAAAADGRFRSELLVHRDEAARARGFDLRESEGALLRAVPEPQLRAAIESLDVSVENLERRAFMRTVALSTAAVAVVEVVAGCVEDGSRPDPPDPDGGSDATDDGAQGESLSAPTGIRPG